MFLFVPVAVRYVGRAAGDGRGRAGGVAVLAGAGGRRHGVRRAHLAVRAAPRRRAHHAARAHPPPLRRRRALVSTVVSYSRTIELTRILPFQQTGIQKRITE